MTQTLQALEDQVRRILPMAMMGSVTKIVGLTASVADFPAPLGGLCTIDRESGVPIQAEVVGFHEDETLLMPYGDLSGVRRGNRVNLVQSVPGIRVGDRLLGRVLDGRGRFLDNAPPPVLTNRVGLQVAPTSPLK